MSDLAIPAELSEGEAPTPASTQRVLAMLVCVALAALWFAAAFALVPAHLLNIVVSLLCANHVTKRFGKGIMPKQYRLNNDDVRADADKLYGALEKEGLTRPALSRVPSSSVFREDKAEISRDVRDGLPAVLHSGLP